METGDRGAHLLPPPPKKKKFRKKYFSGKNNVNLGHFVNFFGHISCKIRDFVIFRANIVKFGHFDIFSCIYFRAKMFCPQS